MTVTVTPVDISRMIDKLLDIDDMAEGDNFFDMGGTSILALRLLAEIEQRWGVTLTLIDVVYNPTPADIARRAAEIAAEAAIGSDSGTEAGSETGSVPESVPEAVPEADPTRADGSS